VSRVCATGRLQPRGFSLLHEDAATTEMIVVATRASWTIAERKKLELAATLALDVLLVTEAEVAWVVATVVTEEVEAAVLVAALELARAELVRRIGSIPTPTEDPSG